MLVLVDGLIVSFSSEQPCPMRKLTNPLWPAFRESIVLPLAATPGIIDTWASAELAGSIPAVIAAISNNFFIFLLRYILQFVEYTLFYDE
jgi:hypothetical protein